MFVCTGVSVYVGISPPSRRRRRWRRTRAASLSTREFLHPNSLYITFGGVFTGLWLCAAATFTVKVASEP